MQALSCSSSQRDRLGNLLGTINVFLACGQRIRVGNARRIRADGWKFVRPPPVGATRELVIATMDFRLGTD
jgi:hypothetical protein